MEPKQIGKVFNYFDKIGVAAVEITDSELNLGDKIKIKGPTTEFEQEVESMQIDGKEVLDVSAGKSVGIKVNDKVRKNDVVYLV